MTLQQLQYIVAVADTGQFSKAARSCHVTQPTLTMMVRKLEEELGVTIFQRKARPALPTTEGAGIIDQARVVLREAGQLKDLVKELHTGTTGTLRIGIIPTLAPYLLPLFLTTYADAHPEARLTIDERRTSRIIEGLRKGELDLGILAGPIDDDRPGRAVRHKGPVDKDIGREVRIDAIHRRQIAEAARSGQGAVAAADGIRQIEHADRIARRGERRQRAVGQAGD